MNLLLWVLTFGLSINFPKLVIHNIDIVIGTKYFIKLSSFQDDLVDFYPQPKLLEV